VLKSSLVLSNVTKLVLALLVGGLFLASWATTSPAALATSTVRTVNATANLQHTPTGTAQLHYDPTRRTLKVTVSLMGLAPNSTHPAHIHQGVCTSNGPIVHSLTNVVANAKGQATVTTVISGVVGGIPPTGAKGWYIMVHNGPTMNSPSQMYAIACGVINNPNRANDVRVLLGSTPDPNQNAVGSTRFTLTGHDLTVTINVSRLAPNSRHDAHVHAGDCSYTQGVLYNLSPLLANGKGNASKTVVFHNVSSIPAHGWDVNVHLSTDLSTQTGYDPILCGNVVLA
jgi:hypothetical protein